MQSAWKFVAVPALALVGASVLFGCGQKPVAKVNGMEITEQAYLEQLERFQPQGSPKSLGEYMLDKLVTEDVILSEAEKQKVAPTDADVDKDVTVMRFKDPNFDASLKKAKRTLDEVKHDGKVEMSLMNLYAKDIKISQKEIEDTYKKDKGLVPHTLPPIAKSQVIVLRTLDDAKKVLAMLDKGANFGMVAKEKSIDMSTKNREGEMDPVMLSEAVPNLDPVLAKALKTLPIGKYSEPISVQGVYAILKVNERTKAKTLDKELSEWVVRRDLMMRKAMEKQKPLDQFIQELKDKAQVEIMRDSVKDALAKPEGAPQQ